MSYRLKFLPIALKEWSKLAPHIQSQFKNKLAERMQTPRIEKDKLRGYSSVYKIKLRAAGYRLVYEVVDDSLIIYVVAVGRRNKNKVYSATDKRV